MSNQVPAGFYRDHHGTLHKCRRIQGDRRKDSGRNTLEPEGRRDQRRADDRHRLRDEHAAAIDEALARFDAEHMPSLFETR